MHCDVDEATHDIDDTQHLAYRLILSVPRMVTASTYEAIGCY